MRWTGARFLPELLIGSMRAPMKSFKVSSVSRWPQE